MSIEWHWLQLVRIKGLEEHELAEVVNGQHLMTVIDGVINNQNNMN